MDRYSFIIENILATCVFAMKRSDTSAWFYNDTVPIDYSNIILISDGEGIFERNDEKIIVKRGDIVFYENIKSRKMRTTDKHFLENYTVNFRYIFTNYYHPCNWNTKWSFEPGNIPLDFVTSIKDEVVFSQLERMFENLCLLYTNKSPIFQRRVQMLLTEILNKIFMYLKNKDTNYSNINRVNNIINYMTYNIGNKILVDDLAKSEHISVPYLITIFKNVTNHTPIEYLNILRLDHAKKLLQIGTSISDITHITGFADISYFSKVFKKSEGVSPAVWRKQNLENFISPNTYGL